MASGILGSSDLSSGANTTVYEVPADTYSVVTVAFCNRSSSTAALRLSVGTSDTPGAQDYLEYDTSLGPNGVLERTGIVADATKKLVVRSSVAGVTAMVMGIETAVPAS
jgi:hypothetical protein